MLPRVDGTAAYRALRAGGAAPFVAAARAIAAKHGLDDADVAPFATGSLPVLALGDAHVVKLVPPHVRGDADVEVQALRRVEGALGGATP